MHSALQNIGACLAKCCLPADGAEGGSTQCLRDAYCSVGVCGLSMGKESDLL